MRHGRTPSASGIMWHERGRVLLDLPADEARDIAMAFSPKDGFARDLFQLADDAEEWVTGERPT